MGRGSASQSQALIPTPVPLISPGADTTISVAAERGHTTDPD